MAAAQDEDDEASTWPERDRDAAGRPLNARPRDRFGAPLPRGSVDAMASRDEPEDVCRTVADAVDRAAELFTTARFFEAHEFLEWAWKGPVTPAADRLLFKGMAQIAVGYTHTQRRNPVGAARLLERGIANLAGYDGVHHGVDVSRATADARAFMTILGEHDPSPDLPFPTFPVAAA